MHCQSQTTWTQHTDKMSDKMKYQVTATAQTVYQLNSLSAFGMGYTKNGNGSFSASMDFDSEEEAKDYLRSRADKYNDEDSCGSEERMSDMYKDIEHGALRLDAVTAHINIID